MKLTNNTILITGGGTGIGLTLAKELTNLGNKVIISGRRLEVLEAVKNENKEIDFIQADVSDEDSIKKLVSTLLEKYPDFNMLINNAGVMHIYDIAKEGINMLDIQVQEINTNIMGPIMLGQLVLPHLLKKQHAAILNVSSGLAYIPIPASPVYSATKAALHSYTLSLRQQLERTSVKVFELLPPIVDTNLVTEVEMSIPKISSEKLVSSTLKALKNNRYEIRPGMTGMMYYMLKFMPFIIKAMMAKDSRKALAGL